MTLADDSINVENDDLICPITFQVFRDPVIANDGHVYERTAITRWILEHGTSPFTRQLLRVEDLRSDDHLRSLATKRRNSTVSYNAQNNSVTLPPFRRALRSSTQVFPHGVPQLNTANRQLRICTPSRICLSLIAVIIIVPITVGIILGISNPTSYISVSPVPSITSTYSNSLSSNSSIFIRPLSRNGTFYYKAIQVIVTTTGLYDIKSVSSINMYGYLYTSDFNSTNSSINLITSDDDTGGNGQFYIQTSFVSGTYTLVATTYSSNITGSFDIVVTGPTNVNFA